MQDSFLGLCALEKPNKARVPTWVMLSRPKGPDKVFMVTLKWEDVDAKINVLKSNSKCSPSSGKSIKRASQFDLKLTREKNEDKFESVSAGIPNITPMGVSASFADTIDDKKRY